MPGSGSAGGSSRDVPSTEGTEYDRVLLEDANEAVEISDIGDTSSAIILRADEDNDGKVYIGWDEDVNDTNGFYIKPDEIFTATLDIDAQTIWAYPVNGNEALMFLAMD